MAKRVRKGKSGFMILLNPGGTYVLCQARGKNSHVKVLNITTKPGGTHVRKTVRKSYPIARHRCNPTMFLRKRITLRKNREFSTDAHNKKVIPLETWLEIKCGKHTGFIRGKYFDRQSSLAQHPKNPTLILRNVVTHDPKTNQFFTGVNVHNQRVYVKEAWVLVRIQNTDIRGFIRKINLRKS